MSLKYFKDFLINISFVSFIFFETLEFFFYVFEEKFVWRFIKIFLRLKERHERSPFILSFCQYSSFSHSSVKNSSLSVVILLTHRKVDRCYRKEFKWWITSERWVYCFAVQVWKFFPLCDSITYDILVNNTYMWNVLVCVGMDRSGYATVCWRRF